MALKTCYPSASLNYLSASCEEGSHSVEEFEPKLGKSRATDHAGSSLHYLCTGESHTPTPCSGVARHGDRSHRLVDRTLHFARLPLPFSDHDRGRIPFTQELDCHRVY